MATYTDQVFNLFSKGFLQNSPEVKEFCKTTKHMQSGLHGLFSLWNKLGKPDHYPHKEKQTSSGIPLGSSTGEVALPSGERVGGFDEMKHSATLEPEIPLIPFPPPPLTLEEPPEERKSEIELGLDETDKQSVSADVIGFGLPIRVQLSIKTLALYQIAASRSEDGLSLGDFLDECCADYFRGRGRDLGLIELEGLKNVG